MTNPASVWSPNGSYVVIPLADSGNTIVHESFLATAAQTLFTLTQFQYMVGTGALMVFKNGGILRPGLDYTETSQSSFTLASGASLNDKVLAIGFATFGAGQPQYFQSNSIVAGLGTDIDPTGHGRTGFFHKANVVAADGTYPSGEMDGFAFREVSTVTASANNGLLFGLAQEVRFDATGFSGNDVFASYDSFALLGGTIPNGYGRFIDTPSISGTVQNLYGLYVQPQVSGSISNYAIYTAGAGKVSFGDDTECRTNLKVLGSVGVGAAAIPNVGFKVVGNLSGSTSQYGMLSNPTVSSASTTSAYGLYSQVSTAAGAYTIAETYGARIGDTALGAGSSVTTQYGLFINNLSAAGTNYAIWTNAGIVNFGDLVKTTASTNASAGLRIPHGAAPGSPVNGDIWTTTAGLYVRINGATVGPLS